MYKLLIIDENTGFAPIISEILGEGYQVLSAAGRFDAEEAVLKEAPQLALVNADEKSCIDIAESLRKKKENLRFIFMGADIGKQSFKKFKPVDKLELPLSPKEFFDRIEYAFFSSEGMIDELTGLLKKSAFDIRLKRLMKKKTAGTFFCLSIDAYSYASNPANPLQEQMAAYAMKKELEGSLLGLSGNSFIGFISSAEAKADMQKRLDKLIHTMCEAADKPEVFISAGAAESADFDYSPEDMLLYADKGMELSRNAGKNCIKYYN